MDEVVNYVNAFLNAEYEALVAQYTERDDRVFQAKRAIVSQFLMSGIPSDLDRPLQPDDEWFERGKERVENGSLMPRTLFQIKVYDHPNFDKLYRAYVSLPLRPRGKRLAYFTNFFISSTQNGYKIVSRYNLDLLPERDNVLFEDGNLAWVWRGGEKLTTLGKLIDVLKFRNPDDPQHLAEYQAK